MCCHGLIRGLAATCTIHIKNQSSSEGTPPVMCDTPGEDPPSARTPTRPQAAPHPALRRAAQTLGGSGSFSSSANASMAARCLSLSSLGTTTCGRGAGVGESLYRRLQEVAGERGLHCPRQLRRQCKEHGRGARGGAYIQKNTASHKQIQRISHADRHLEVHEEVAKGRARRLQVLDPVVAQRHDLPRLRAWGHRDHLRAVERRHLHLPAEHRLATGAHMCVKHAPTRVRQRVGHTLVGASCAPCGRRVARNLRDGDRDIHVYVVPLPSENGVRCHLCARAGGSATKGEREQQTSPLHSGVSVFFLTERVRRWGGSAHGAPTCWRILLTCRSRVGEY